MKSISVPEGWRSARLSELCDPHAPIMYGILQPGPEVEGGVPYVRPTEIDDDGIKLEEIKRTSVEIAEQYRRATLKADDLLITIVGTLGKIALVPKELEGGNITQSSARIRLAKEVADVRYIRQVLRAPVATRQYDYHKLGTGVPRLNIHHVRDLVIPLPLLPEQRRIAEILDKADALRAKRRAAIAQLDTLTQSIFLDMFGDPATNPKRFPVRALSELYVNQMEGTKCGPFGSALKKSEFVQKGVPVWNMDNIDPSGRMVMPFRMYISEGKYRQLESYSVIDGDVLVSRAGTVGKMCVARMGAAKAIISTNLIRLRFGPDLLPLYFVSLMTYCKGRVGRLKTGPDGALTHMNTGVLDTLRFPYPPVEMQRRFAVIADSIESRKSRQIAQLEQIESLFDSIQQRAFGRGL